MTKWSYQDANLKQQRGKRPWNSAFRESEHVFLASSRLSTPFFRILETKRHHQWKWVSKIDQPFPKPWLTVWKDHLLQMYWIDLTLSLSNFLILCAWSRNFCKANSSSTHLACHSASDVGVSLHSELPVAGTSSSPDSESNELADGVDSAPWDEVDIWLSLISQK